MSPSPHHNFLDVLVVCDCLLHEVEADNRSCKVIGRGQPLTVRVTSGPQLAGNGLIVWSAFVDSLEILLDRNTIVLKASDRVYSLKREGTTHIYAIAVAFDVPETVLCQFEALAIQLARFQLGGGAELLVSPEEARRVFDVDMCVNLLREQVTEYEKGIRGRATNQLFEQGLNRGLHELTELSQSASAAILSGAESLARKIERNRDHHHRRGGEKYSREIHRYESEPDFFSIVEVNPPPPPASKSSSPERQTTTTPSRRTGTDNHDAETRRDDDDDDDDDDAPSSSSSSSLLLSRAKSRHPFGRSVSNARQGAKVFGERILRKAESNRMVANALTSDSLRTVGKIACAAGQIASGLGSALFEASGTIARSFAGKSSSGANAQTMVTTVPTENQQVRVTIEDLGNVESNMLEPFSERDDGLSVSDVGVSMVVE